jgi:Zn-dependent peptidase ImmA (M78 family)
MSEKLARAEAESVAEQVLKDCKFSSLPICPFEIAKKKGIHVDAKQSSKPGVSGFLMRVGSSFGIAYASHIQNEGFIRFTVAHELGHYFLPEHPLKLSPQETGRMSHRAASSR